MQFKETDTLSYTHQDYHEIIPGGFIEVKVTQAEWIDEKEPLRNIAIWLVPVERKYAHEIFFININIGEKIGFLGKKLLHITTKKEALPEPKEIPDVVDSIVGKRLRAYVISEKDGVLYRYQLVDIAPLETL
jgi:hypothetical protein